MTACPHCPDGHDSPLRKPWGVYVAPTRDGDGQPTTLHVVPSNGAHVAESDAEWLRALINGDQTSAAEAVDEVLAPLKAHVGVAEYEWQQALRRAEQAEAEVARLRAGEADTPSEPGVELTPSQWIRRWNEATQEERLQIAAAGRANAQAAYQCFLMDHEGRLADAEATTRQAQATLARVREACLKVTSRQVWDDGEIGEHDHAMRVLKLLDGAGTVSEEQSGGGNESEVRCLVADAGAALALRSSARQIREALQAFASPGDVIVLDFAGVEVVTNGFADELVAELIAESPDRRVVIEGATEVVREAIAIVLARRGQTAPGFPPAITTEETP